MKPSLLNSLYQWSCHPSFHRFIDDSQSLQIRQTEILVEILQSPISYAAFAKRFPVTAYADWEESVAKQRQTETCKTFQPTSGSGGRRKWVPYTEKLRQEFADASSPWIYDLHTRFPQIRNGTQYWSLSWLPDQDRKEKIDVDDSKLFSFFKAWILKQLFAVPNEVATASSAQESLLATACFLAGDQNLSLISVWSPSFLLTLLETILQKREIIREVLTSGKWKQFSSFRTPAPFNPKAAEILSQLSEVRNADIWKRLWPKLSLISCWDSAMSKPMAEDLRTIFSDVPIQGKGVWTTEAVVTIPFQGRYPLAYQSHFYEFQDVRSKRILPSWELKIGMRVMPIVTTGSGFIRYLIEDVLEVTEFWNQIPCFLFRGRAQHTDLVGEKLDSASVLEIFRRMDNARPLSLFACPSYAGQAPRYLLLAQEASLSDRSLIVSQFEKHLCEHFHYRLARDLGQLAAVQFIGAENPSEIYHRLMEKRGLIRGDIKIEPLNTLRGQDELNWLVGL